MPDGFVKVRKGEKRPLYGQATMASGTLTVVGFPVPTLTLFDGNGVVVSGLNGVAAAGYDAGALSAPRVWYVLDTATLAPGFYTGVFQFTASGSDGITRVYAPSVAIQVLEVTA
jgi:hypothetical protein